MFLTNNADTEAGGPAASSSKANGKSPGMKPYIVSFFFPLLQVSDFCVLVDEPAKRRGDDVEV